MSVYDHRCDVCAAPCPECGRPPWCEGDRILRVPCEHHGYCGECNLEHCAACRQEAFAEMCADGGYDPEADPFVIPTARESQTLAETLAESRAEVERYEAETGFNAATNSYQKRRA